MAKKTNSDKSGNTTGKSPKKTKTQQKREKQKKLWIIRIVALIIIAAILGGSMLFEKRINTFLRLKGVIEQDYDAATTQEAVGEGVVKLGEKLNVHFVDVGQGDACIIELPDEKKMIIDGGKDSEKQKLLSYIDQHILTDEGEKIEEFDYAVLTHSDEDHCGGLDDVLLKYPAGIFYRPNQLATYQNYNDPGKNLLFGSNIQGFAKDTRAYMRAIDAGHSGASKVIVTDARKDVQNKITPSGRDRDHAEYYEINFYTPTKDNYNDVNDYSPIIILEYQGKRISLSGDAEAEAEAEFVALANTGEGRYARFDDRFTVDIIKLGHHGSRSSSSEAYLKAITTPSSVKNVIIIISCGAGNSYGHPHSDVIKRLLEMGFLESNILRTDINGNIAMSIREDNNAEYQLYRGADIVWATRDKPIAWREIAIIIFVGAVIILIMPSLLKNKKLAKKFKIK